MKTVPPTDACSKPTVPMDVVELKRTFPFSAVIALFILNFKNLLRGRRLLVLSLLYCLPIGLTVLFRYYLQAEKWSARLDLLRIEIWIIYMMIPHTLLPITTLLFASGIIQDEIEEQTLTYLLIRPIPRWAIYLAKFCSAALAACLINAIFTLLTVMVFWSETMMPYPELLTRAGYVILAMSLATLAYTGIFGLLSLLLRRSLLIGFVYILLFEGILANIPFIVRQFTVMYYERLLFLNWSDVKRVGQSIWSFEKLEAYPDQQSAIMTLVLIAFFATMFGCYLFTSKEFRVKTPESGS